MVSLLAQSAIDRGFEPRSGQTQDYKIGISSFSVNHVALRRKSKDWLAQNQNNVSEWGNMSICGLLFSELAKNPAKRVGLVQSRHHHHLIKN